VAACFSFYTCSWSMNLRTLLPRCTYIPSSSSVYFESHCVNLNPLDEFEPTARKLRFAGAWRALVLSYSHLWAQNTNIDQFNQLNTNWRSQVLCRTGMALPNLSGTVYDGPKAVGLRAFLVWVLTSHWVLTLGMCQQRLILRENVGTHPL